MRHKHLFLPLVVICFLLVSHVLTQDDDDETDDDEDSNFVDNYDGYENDEGGEDGGGFFPMGSENFEEIPGGIFEQDADSDVDPIDFMDSNKKSSVALRNVLPTLMRPYPKDADQTVIHDPPVPFLPSKVPNDVHSNHPGISEGHLMIKDLPSLINRHPDSYDPERRSRYTGYDDELEDDSSTDAESRSTEPDSEPRDDFNQDFDRFPRGTFYGFDGFYGDAKLMHDRLLMNSHLKMKPFYRQNIPCEGDCDR